MGAARFEKSVQLASSVDDVWPLIIDTDRVNRLMGMAPVNYTPIEAALGVSQAPAGTPARYIGETVIVGMNVRYEEIPFEWAYKKGFASRRVFMNGPMKWFELAFKLDPPRPSEGGFEGGCTLTVTFEAEPRNALFAPVVWIGGKQTVGSIVTLGRALDAYVQGNNENPFALPVSGSDPAKIERGLAELLKSDVDKDIAKRLASHLKDAADADCVRMRPYEIADGWKVDRREVLRTFLHAVPAGLLELRWSIVCPSCRTTAQRVDKLEDVPLEGHCQLCDIGFDLDLDRAVEATFIPHPAARTVPPMMFCIGGPARTPHVLSQVNVAASKQADLFVPNESGRYRLFARGGSRTAVRVDADGSAEVTVTYGEDKLSPAEIHVRPGGAIRVENRSGEARHVKLERLEYGSAAATAHDLTLLAEFRTLFSAQLLKRGTPLKVARAAILFTDLTGSTALYSEVGDAAAFRLVDDHFDILRAAIAETGGTVIKTMGDAIMAAFPDASGCARGAIHCLDRFEEFRAANEHGSLVHLKLGMFSGACYVITANGVLDYFGQTVNVASRLQHLAASGEIILEEGDADALQASERERLSIGEVFEARVKGVERPLRIVRARMKTAVVDPTSLSSVKVSSLEKSDHPQ